MKINFDIDALIVGIYFLLNLVIGLRWGKNVKSLKDYALGGRNFSTATLTATIIATWASGSALFVGVTAAYQDGLLKFCAATFAVIGNLVIAYLIAPRVREFFGKLSVADVMGDLYGSKVRLVTSITSVILSIGFVSLQLKVMSSIVSYTSGIAPMSSTILCATLVVIYCAFGGVRSVIFTDILQFVTFIVGLISLLFALLYEVDFANSPDLFNKAWKHAFNFQSQSGVDYITLAIIGLIPTMTPAIFQRILIGKDTKQVSTAFKISAILDLIYMFTAAIIGILLFTYKSDLEYRDIFSFMVEEFSYSGMRSLIFITILALAMSTLDSHLNAASVTFSHDICKPLGFIKKEKHELIASRIFTVFAGVFAVFLAIRFQNIIQLLLFTKNFYTPIVMVPLLLAIFGFRSKSHIPVLIGMAGGAVVVVSWRMFIMEKIGGIDSLIPGMLANSIFFMGSHYLFGFKGGWIGQRDQRPLEEIEALNSLKKKAQKDEFISFFSLFFNINGKVTKPSFIKLQNSVVYSLLGVVIVLSSLVVTFSSAPVVEIASSSVVILFIYLGISGILITYPLWDHHKSIRISCLLHLFAIFSLMSNSTFMMFVFGFSTASIVNLIINFVISFIFLNVGVALILFCFNSLCSYLLFISSYGTGLHLSESYSGTSVIIYSTFMVTTILLFFLRKQQEDFDTAIFEKSKLGELSKLLEYRLQQREESIKKILNVKENIIQNVSHEIRTPLNIAINNAQILLDVYDDPKYKSKLKDIIEAMYLSIKNLHSYASNMIDLSIYESGKMLFDIQKNDLHLMLKKIVDPKNIEMLLGKNNNRVVTLSYSIDCEILVEFDTTKLEQVINNLITNAANYSSNSVIEVEVKKGTAIYHSNKYWNSVLISVKDQGIGIPEDELEKIFDSFYLSSRTRDGSGGRGLSLAICKNIIASHAGKIWAQNNKDTGAEFFILLPINRPSDGFLSKESDFTQVKAQNNEIDLSAMIQEYKEVETNAQAVENRKMILFVDDDSAMQGIARIILPHIGYDVEIAGSGEEALELLEQDPNRYDLILLDIMMPGISGIEMLKHGHNIIANHNIPVILQSGLDDPIYFEQSKKYGAKAFVRKPYSMRGLKAIIDEHIKQSN